MNGLVTGCKSGVEFFPLYKRIKPLKYLTVKSIENIERYLFKILVQLLLNKLKLLQPEIIILLINIDNITKNHYIIASIKIILNKYYVRMINYINFNFQK